MIEPLLGAIVIVLAAIIAVYWVRSVVRFDPGERCDPKECETCPFRSDDCRWRGDKPNEMREQK